MPVRDRSNAVERTLTQPDVHLAWEERYRHALNERFYEMAFDHLVAMLRPDRDPVILDAGCGPAYHSIRLARRGFRVVAADFSESALAMARGNLVAAGLAENIVLRRENLLNLSFPDGHFEYILCWGVLMHIPEVERAIGELARVLQPGGKLIVSEGNRHAPEARLRMTLRAWRRARKGETTRTALTPAGIELWTDSSAGPYLSRLTDIPYMIRQFAGHGLHVQYHSASQFSEAYAQLSGEPLKRLVFALNGFYYRRVRHPGPAVGNLLIFERRR